MPVQEEDSLNQPNTSTTDSTVNTGSKLAFSSTSSFQRALDDFDYVPRTAADVRKTGRGPASATKMEMQTAVTVSARTGPERLHRCWDYLQQLQASSGGSSDPAVPAPSIHPLLLEQCQEDDYWLLVQCGEWLPGRGPEGAAGPALALLQVWYDSVHSFADYMVWELGPDGWPTGAFISSATGTGPLAGVVACLLGFV